MSNGKSVGPGSRTGSSKGTRQPIKPEAFEKGTPTRGSSIQGERQDAKGGPAGANQGGASRGGSRVEPSHQIRTARQARAKKK